MVSRMEKRRNYVFSEKALIIRLRTLRNNYRGLFKDGGRCWKPETVKPRVIEHVLCQGRTTWLCSKCCFAYTPEALRQLPIHLHFHLTFIYSLVPFSFFSFGNEVRHYFVLFRSLRNNFAGSQATGEENEQAFALEEIRVYKHIILQRSSYLCLAFQCFAR